MWRERYPKARLRLSLVEEGRSTQVTLGSCSPSLKCDYLGTVTHREVYMLTKAPGGPEPFPGWSRWEENEHYIRLPCLQSATAEWARVQFVVYVLMMYFLKRKKRYFHPDFWGWRFAPFFKYRIVLKFYARWYCNIPSYLQPALVSRGSWYTVCNKWYSSV